MYNTIWRWHFYAELFCIPFVLVLSITGAIYLYKPQIEAVLDQLMRVVHCLQGELLIGDIGSNLVELAASWAIVMIITGLYLWWRRRSPSLLGVPQARATLSFASVLTAVIVVLGALLPFRGITLLAALLVERWVLRYVPSARNFLGLNKVVVAWE